MTDLADPVVACIEALRSSPYVGNALGSTAHIYGGEIPADIVKQMPMRVIIVNPAGTPGGIGENSYVPVSVQRLDVLCYGRNRMEAGALAIAARYALKTWHPGLSGGVRVHWFKQSAGPIQFRDPDGNWPASVVSFNVMIDDALAT